MKQALIHNSKLIWLWWIAIVALITVGTYLKFSISHELPPKGCDEFGYLQLAEAFNQDKAYADLVERSYLSGLKDTLEKENIIPQLYQWMITPHAYHFSGNGNQIINQYAPGTSWILGFFSADIRQKVFPAFIMLFTLLIPVLLMKWSNKFKPEEIYTTMIVLSVFAVVMSLAPPFHIEVGRINSLALTFSLLITAGILHQRKTAWSIVLIAISANFRLVNLLTLLPFVFVLWNPFINHVKAKDGKSASLFIFKHLALVFIPLIPYMLYAYQLLGNPFSVTYSTIDTAFAQGNEFIQNLFFYFDPTEAWFHIHLISLVGIIILNRVFKEKLTPAQWGLIITLPILNYAFFMTHKVQINYYPYGSGMLLLGIFIGMLAQRFYYKGKLIGLVTLPSILALILFIDGVNRFSSKDHISWEEALKQHGELCEYDVVWSDIYSGTTEYVCGNYGFVMHAGSVKSRIIAWQYLHNHQYKQVLLIEDTPLPLNQLEKELELSKLNYKLITLKEFGNAVVIE